MRKYRKLHARYIQKQRASTIMIDRFNRYRQRIRSKYKKSRNCVYLFNTGSLINYFITVKRDMNDLIYYKRKSRKCHNEKERKNNEYYKEFMIVRFWSSFNSQRNDYNELMEERE